MIYYKAKFILFFIWLVPYVLPAQPQESLWEVNDSQSRISEKWHGITVNRRKLNRDVLAHVLSDIDRNGSSTISIPHPSGTAMQFNTKPSNLSSGCRQEPICCSWSIRGRQAFERLSKLALKSSEDQRETHLSHN